MSEYPQHMALKAIQPKSQAIHEFLEWANSAYGLQLATYINNRMYPTHLTPTKLCAEFFEIDLKKLEEEKEQMIEEMRKANDKPKEV